MKEAIQQIQAVVVGMDWAEVAIILVSMFALAIGAFTVGFLRGEEERERMRREEMKKTLARWREIEESAMRERGRV